MIRRDVILKAESVEQRLLHPRPLAHHWLVSRIDTSIESERHDNFNRKFLTQSRALRMHQPPHWQTFDR